MRRSAFSTTVAVVGILAWCAFATSQEPTHRAVDRPESSPSTKIEEAKPPLYYLKDEQGNLVAVPGFTLKDFEQLYKLQQGQGPQEQRPSYSLQKIAITGTCTKEQADLNVHINIQVREENWVRVPLRLDRGLLREAAQYRGGGEHFLHFEPEGDGYVSWLRGQPNQQHEVILKMLVPLQLGRDETRLRLAVPRATSSELKLKVPLANAVGRVSERATLQQTANAGNGSTEFTVLNPGGDFELAWRRSGAEVAEVQPVLEATATIVAQIDTRSVDTSAVLTVRSLAAPFDAFRVHLPPQSELLPASGAGYTVTPVATAGGEAAAAQPTVEIRLPKKTSGPVEVRLTARRPPLPNKADQWTELAGFEVVGAARQSGTIAVTVMNDWQILWGASRSVRQAEQVSESLRREDLAAAFDYFAQPFSLTARLVPKKTRIHVEPEYRITVDAHEARLDARLKFVLRGGKVFAVEVGLADWELEDVGPENIVATDGVAVHETTKLTTIPLLQPTAGPIEVRLRARRPLSEGAKSLSLQLPQPKASSASSASALIVSADNVELIPKSSGMQGLVREQVPPQTNGLDRQQPVLFYRSEASKAVFAADLRIHQRQITAHVRTDVQIDERTVQVEQKLSYNVAHEPTDELRVSVPAALAHADDLQFMYQGIALSAAPDDSPPSADPTAPLAFRMLLPTPVMGSCEITARFSAPVPAFSTGHRTQVQIPLTTPLVDRMSANRLTVKAARGLLVEPMTGPWSLATGAATPPGPARAIELLTEEQPEDVALVLQEDASALTAEVIVDRQWLQTWFTETTRQDRFVARFSTSVSPVELVVPPAAASGQLSLVLDGKRLGDLAIRENRVVLPVEGDAATMHVLEARYHFPGPRPPRGAMAVDMPRLGPAGWVRRQYWQVVLPKDEHMLLTPEGFLSESTVGWQRFFWARRPLLDQADLEIWTGAPARGPLPPAANCYLFGALGHVEQTELRTAGRTMIVAIASGTALAVCLVLLYIPILRRPLSVLLLTGLVGAGLLVPEIALLVAQAAALGIVLGALAVILARQIGRRRPAPPTHGEGLSSRTRLVSAPVAAPASTKSAPALEHASSEPLS